MNQTEEIEKQQKRLASLESDLRFAEEEFDKKYSLVKRRIDELDREWRALHNKKEWVRLQTANVISREPKKYLEGFHGNLNKDIDEFGKDLKLECVLWRQNYHDAVWRKFNNLLETVPESKAFSTRLDNILKEATDLKETTPGYLDLDKKICDLKSNIKSLEDFIKRLGDISYFRQHAKAIKKRDEEDLKRKANDEKISVFTDWFDKNYLPKMKKAIIDACED